MRMFTTPSVVRPLTPGFAALPPGAPDTLDTDELEGVDEEFSDKETCWRQAGNENWKSGLADALTQRLSSIDCKLDSLIQSVAKIDLAAQVESDKKATSITNPCTSYSIPNVMEDLREFAKVKKANRLSVESAMTSPREGGRGRASSKTVQTVIITPPQDLPNEVHRDPVRSSGLKEITNPSRQTWWSEVDSSGSDDNFGRRSHPSTACRHSRGEMQHAKSNAAWAVQKSRTMSMSQMRLSKIRWQVVQVQTSKLKRAVTHCGFGGIEVVEGREPWGWQLVHGISFQTVSCVLVILNAFFIGFSCDMALKAQMDDRKVDAWMEVVETIFEVSFVLELLARLILQRCDLFFRGPEWKWNIFDLVLVVNSLVDTIILNLDYSWGKNLMVARLLRVLRFLRLTRIVRVMRRISSVRLVLFSILDSMSSLFWCFAVLFSLIYVFAILFMNATAEHLSDVGIDSDDNVRQTLTTFFGSLYRSMLTLFMVITNGLDWYTVAEAMMTVNFYLYGPMFWFFIFMMQFGVMNIVVGTFVAQAADIASRDRDVMVKRELQSMVSMTNRIKTFFQEADVDESGTLSWEEFKAHLEKPEVKAYFASMDLDVSQAHYLFALLDEDHNNSISIDEFLEGCLRLKGQARSIDIHVLLAGVRKLSERVDSYIILSNKRNDKLTTQLAALTQAKAG